MKAAVLRKTSSDIPPLEFERPSALNYYLRRRWKLEPTPDVRLPVEVLPQINRTITVEAIKQASYVMVAGLCVQRVLKDLDSALSPPLYKGRFEVASFTRAGSCYRAYESIPARRERLRKQRDGFSRLEEAANRGSEADFLKSLESIKWDDRTAAEFVRAIKLAFKAGAFRAALYIASEGLKHHSEDITLQKYVRVLKPNQPPAAEQPAEAKPQANREWLKAHANEYKGQWIALRNGELLGASRSLETLTEEVSRKFGVTFPSREVLVTTGA